LKLKQWTDHFVSQGTDTYTANRRALVMLYRGAIEQALSWPTRTTSG
jgi:hypothetical protein